MRGCGGVGALEVRKLLFLAPDVIYEMHTRTIAVHVVEVPEILQTHSNLSTQQGENCNPLRERGFKLR
jgi:hypothetical protein